VAFSLIITCSKTYTFFAPSPSVGDKFTVRPTLTLQKTSPAGSSVGAPPNLQHISVTVPSWLAVTDSKGNPLDPQLARAVSEGSITLG
jgi:hypothetical protein